MRMPQLNHFSGTQIWNTLAESWPALFLFIVCLLTRLLLYHKWTFLIQYMVLQATDDGLALGGPSFLSPKCVTHFLPILFHWGTLNIRYLYWNSPPTHSHTHHKYTHTHTHTTHTHTHNTHTTNTHTHTTHTQHTYKVQLSSVYTRKADQATSWLCRLQQQPLSVATLLW